MHKIVLPFPPKDLNPNKRYCWQAKQGSKRDSRDAGYAAALPLRGKVIGDEKTGRIPITIIFYMPDRRGRDLDNLHSASKQMLDGVALGLGVNDRYFRPVTIDDAPPDGKGERTEIIFHDD